MDPREFAFLQGINGTDDPQLRAVYADWLEDAGRPVEAAGWRWLAQSGYSPCQDYYPGWIWIREGKRPRDLSWHGHWPIWSADGAKEFWRAVVPEELFLAMGWFDAYSFVSNPRYVQPPYVAIVGATGRCNTERRLWVAKWLLDADGDDAVLRLLQYKPPKPARIPEELDFRTYE